MVSAEAYRAFWAHIERAARAVGYWPPPPEWLDERLGTIETEGLCVDLPARRVFVDGVEVHLTPREFDLLAVLARQSGQALGKAYLLQAVFGPGYEGANGELKQLVFHLRRKLLKCDPDQAHAHRIAPVYGFGYRLDPR